MDKEFFENFIEVIVKKMNNASSDDEVRLLYWQLFNLEKPINIGAFYYLYETVLQKFNSKEFFSHSDSDRNCIFVVGRTPNSSELIIAFEPEMNAFNIHFCTQQPVDEDLYYYEENEKSREMLLCTIEDIYSYDYDDPNILKCDLFFDKNQSLMFDDDGRLTNEEYDYDFCCDDQYQLIVCRLLLCYYDEKKLDLAKRIMMLKDKMASENAEENIYFASVCEMLYEQLRDLEIQADEISTKLFGLRKKLDEATYVTKLGKTVFDEDTTTKYEIYGIRKKEK